VLPSAGVAETKVGATPLPPLVRLVGAIVKLGVAFAAASCSLLEAGWV